MKSGSIKLGKGAVAAVVLILACRTLAVAADGSGFTRESYDLLMRWVNFFIMAALIVKYVRRPFMDFIRQKRNEVAGLLKKYEDQKKEATDKIREYQILLAANQDHLKLIRENILAEGQRLKEKAIADARLESEMMMNLAQVKIEHQIREAYRKVRHDLIDAAARQALFKASAVLTAGDHQRLFEQWIDAAGEKTN